MKSARVNQKRFLGGEITISHFQRLHCDSMNRINIIWLFAWLWHWLILKWRPTAFSDSQVLLNDMIVHSFEEKTRFGRKMHCSFVAYKFIDHIWNVDNAPKTSPSVANSPIWMPQKLNWPSWWCKPIAATVECPAPPTLWNIGSRSHNTD